MGSSQLVLVLRKMLTTVRTASPPPCCEARNQLALLLHPIPFSHFPETTTFSSFVLSSFHLSPYHIHMALFWFPPLNTRHALLTSYGRWLGFKWQLSPSLHVSSAMIVSGLVRATSSVLHYDHINNVHSWIMESRLGVPGCYRTFELWLWVEENQNGELLICP